MSTSTQDVMFPESVVTLANAWNGLKSANPRLRIRDAAKELKVSEAELVQTNLGKGTLKLKPGFAETLLTALPSFAELMVLTRNEACVLEHTGTVDQVELVHNNSIATVLGKIELRSFLRHWVNAWYVETITPERSLYSIQVFDASGVAVAKIYKTENTNAEAWQGFLNNWVADDNGGEWFRPAPKTKRPEMPDAMVNAEALVTEWAELNDTHDFHMLLAKHRVGRMQSLRLAEGKFTYAFDLGKTEELLRTCAENEIPVMIFAGNNGNIQIHQDFIKNVKPIPGWLNIMDEHFNMHLNEAELSQAWLVRKPTTDGVVTSIEIFDKENELAVQIFGLRKPGIEERADWRALAEKMTNIIPA